MNKLIYLICNPQKGPVAKLYGLANIADVGQLEKKCNRDDEWPMKVG